MVLGAYFLALIIGIISKKFLPNKTLVFGHDSNTYKWFSDLILANNFQACQGFLWQAIGHKKRDILKHSKYPFSILNQIKFSL